jgi:hypothetical protein
MTANSQSRGDFARMTLDVPIQEHKKLKAMAAFRGISLKDLVLSCVRDNLLSTKFKQELNKQIKRGKDEESV